MAPSRPTLAVVLAGTLTATGWAQDGRPTSRTAEGPKPQQFVVSDYTRSRTLHFPDPLLLLIARRPCRRRTSATLRGLTPYCAMAKSIFRSVTPSRWRWKITSISRSSATTWPPLTWISFARILVGGTWCQYVDWSPELPEGSGDTFRGNGGGGAAARRSVSLERVLAAAAGQLDSGEGSFIDNFDPVLTGTVQG